MAQKLYNKGSEWRRWDLHVHTASSYDYKYKGDDSDELLVKAWRDNNISAVAITDHFKIDSTRILKLRKLAPEITIFPGVELRSDKGTTNLHVIIIFSEKIDVIKISNSFNVIMLDTNAKGADNPETIYWDYNDIIKFAKDNNGIVSIHSGRKTNGLDREISSCPVNLAIKKEIADSIRIFEIGNTKDIIDFNTHIFPKIGIKPLVLCSDNHNPREYRVKEYTWIKADPTFEGLKQIIYEPEERVKIQNNQPEYKDSYRIIESIILENKDNNLWNNEIHLNPNLNVIIGGRATGKSTLLNSIAKKLNSIREIDKKGDNNSFKYIDDNNLLDSMEILWQDKINDEDRKVDFYSQGFMYDIADDREKKDIEILKIIKEYSNYNLIEEYESWCNDNKKDIENKIRILFQEYTKYLNIEADKNELGDRKGIEAQIKILEENLRIKESNTLISKEQYSNFNELYDELNKITAQIQIMEQDKKQLGIIVKKEIFIPEYRLEFNNLSKKPSNTLSLKYDKMKQRIENYWNCNIKELINYISNEIDNANETIKKGKESEIFIKGTEFLEANRHLQEDRERLIYERNKIKQYEELDNMSKTIKEQGNKLIYSIIERHNEYLNELDKLCKTFDLTENKLNIKAEKYLKKQEVLEYLESVFNKNTTEGKKYCEEYLSLFMDDKSNKLVQLLTQLLFNNIPVKKNISYENIAKHFFSTNWYGYNFNLIYDNDKFDEMSPGKKAFVVLKLLLEFSKNQNPILIDQPEDSLDNRAIYNELVTYIKEKKKDRQIIIVTHNSNVVVNADAEQVIVANQHGNDSKNKDGVKFQYITGSIESIIDKPIKGNSILESKSIREHICEIMEGGNEAFKKRENRYKTN